MSDPRFMCYVALLEAQPLSSKVLASRIASLFPSVDPQPQIVEAPGKSTGEAFIVKVRNVPLVIMYVPAPVPREVFTDDVQQRAWRGWKEMAEKQKAHYIVSNLEASAAHAQALNAAVSVIAAAAAVAKELPSAGVYWVPSELFIEPSVFVQQAVRALPTSLPIECLVKSLWYKDARSEAHGLVTLGLEPFVGREIDHAPTKEGLSEIYIRSLNLASYLALNGPVIKDGDTIGSSAKERVVVRFEQKAGKSVYGVHCA